MIESAAIAVLRARLDALEAESEIRVLMARYMEICDCLDDETPMDELADLFTKDAVWSGKGDRYDAAFGTHDGRAEIATFLNEYRDPPHFAMNAHFLTSERISVDGDAGQGSWMMLQTPTFRNGESYLMCAALDVGFRNDLDRWRICRFQTANIFSRKLDHGWNDGLPVPKPGQEN